MFVFQALASAVALLEVHAFDSYEAHVALRTVRTVDATERVLPSARIDWALKAEAQAATSISWVPNAGGGGGGGGLRKAERGEASTLGFVEGWWKKAGAGW